MTKIIDSKIDPEAVEKLRQQFLQAAEPFMTDDYIRRFVAAPYTPQPGTSDTRSGMISEMVRSMAEKMPCDIKPSQETIEYYQNRLAKASGRFFKKTAGVVSLNDESATLVLRKHFVSMVERITSEAAYGAACIALPMVGHVCNENQPTATL